MRGTTRLLLGICIVSLTACGGSKKYYSGGFPDEGLDNTVPYVTSGAYSSALKGCATAGGGQSCTLNQLPPLGMESPSPTVADIMCRTLVSHAWMGERFEQVLNRMPDDMLQLFGALTVVVIDDDIRPSYYNPATGAIYLDPGYLWLTEEEESVINDQEDYRGEYIRQMAYRPVWRYVNGIDRSARTLDTIVVDMAQLLFHELAHANDIFPPASYATVNRAMRIKDVTSSLYDQYPSTQLLLQYPLESDVMFALADILYSGVTASASYRAFTPSQVGGYFEPDGANDDYNYSSQYEDVAMLFEEAMMKLHFNMDRDVGFTSAPNSYNCAAYILGWGMRNRLGMDKIKTRAAWVVAELLPNSDYSTWFESFPAARRLQTDISWCDSDVTPPAAREKSFSSGPDNRQIDKRNLLPSGGLPPGF